MKPIVAALAALAACAAIAGPHQHGVGHLQAAVEGGTLTVELRLPAKDLIGFERPPRNDAERARIEDVRKTLADPALFAPSAAGGCKPGGAPAVEAPQFGGKDADENHADFSAAYRFECANPAGLATLEHGVFKAFPRIKQLKVQAVGPKGQKQATLTHGKPRFAF